MRKGKIRNIAVFISGGGSTFKYICDAFRSGEFHEDIKISALVASNPNAGGIKFAERFGIPYRVIVKSEYATDEEYGRAIIRFMDECNVHLICMAGFLKKMPENVLEEFPDHVLNQHPADTTVPEFRGKYGRAVHEAVHASGAKRTCVTIQYVKTNYDEGRPVIQLWMDIPEGATVEQIQDGLLPLEHRAYVAAIKAVIEIERQKAA